MKTQLILKLFLKSCCFNCEITLEAAVCGAVELYWLYTVKYFCYVTYPHCGAGWYRLFKV